MTASNAYNWRDDARCKGTDPESYFPATTRSTVIREAKAVCAECPVTAECEQFANDNNIRDGIWGGKTPPERGRPKRTAPQSRPKGAPKGQMFAPPRILAAEQDLIRWKLRRKTDDEIAALLECSPTSMKLARHQLGIAPDGSRVEPKRLVAA